MPGIPVAARATSSHPDACEHLSAEEELAAEESLSIYCKPVELYNILQRRAMRNPSFLQRCLHYRIKAKHKKRIQMAVSLTRTITESQNVFPMSICLARRISDHGASRQTAIYQIGRIFIFRNSPGIDLNTQVQANFTLPEVNKLAEEARSCSLDILFVSTATAGEYCLCGKVSLESLYMAWDCFPNFRLGQRAEIMSTVDLLPCILKSDFLNEDTRISIQVPSNFENMSTSKQVQITISAEEFGAKEKSPYLSYAGGEVPSSSLSHIIGLREGNVMFNYRYYNNKLQRTEGISATIIRSHPDRDSVPSMSDCDQAVLQFAKTRKLSIERPDPRNSTLLRKRQFFHSHKAQPMAIEQVVSDKDSEDEVDDDVADFEDRRMLENFVDVSKDEKSLMHMWNSFVRKHRVIADGHISWACEAFSKLHAPEFVQSPSLAGCWRIFMVKLYNHGLLDARTMNDCNIILEQYQRQNSDPKR
uniref:Uncharacterized protein n=1 Tax=Glycine max TaxID=3847 RepID=A0A0R0HS44_SOYBN